MCECYAGQLTLVGSRKVSFYNLNPVIGGGVGVNRTFNTYPSYAKNYLMDEYLSFSSAKNLQGGMSDQRIKNR